jgi:hypothetical protein
MLAGFNYEMGCCFDDRMIEDFWISYYCVTTDLTDSGAEKKRSASSRFS